MKNPKGPKAVKNNGKYLSLHTYWRLPRKIKKEMTIGAFSRNIHPMSILSTISTCKVTQRVSYTHRNTRAARKLEKLFRHEERITHERMQRDIIRNISSRFDLCIHNSEAWGTNEIRTLNPELKPIHHGGISSSRRQENDPTDETYTDMY